MLFDELPEAPRMVRLAWGGQLVHDDVVEDVEWSEHEAPVEQQRPAGGARSPAGALVANLDPRRPHADARRFLLDEHRDELADSGPRIRLADTLRVQPEPRPLL